MSSQGSEPNRTAIWEELANVPFASPPEGVVPDFDNPGYHGQPVIIVAALCLVFLVAMLFIRLYAKIRVTKKITPDDYIYFVSWPAGVALICLFLVDDVGGLYGYHQWDLRLKDLTKRIIIQSLVGQCLYGPFSWLYRLCLFSLIYYVFAPLRRIRLLVYTGVVVSFLVYMLPIPIYAFECRPRGGHDRLAWVLGAGSPNCSGSKGLGYIISIVVGAWNLVVDLYLLLLPIPAIRSLQINKTQKLGIFVVFGAAIIGCLASLIVLIFRVRLYGTTDLTYEVIPVFAVGMIETTVALSIPCAASIAAVWQHFQRRRNEQASGSYYTSGRRAHAKSNANSTYSKIVEDSNDSWNVASLRSMSYELKPTAVVASDRVAP